jgi:hypothetical protein
MLRKILVLAMFLVPGLTMAQVRGECQHQPDRQGQRAGSGAGE